MHFPSDKTVNPQFYHLADRAITDQPCRGLACQVARHLNPTRWKAAARQEPRVYCLGKCYAAPAAADLDERPRIEVHTAEPVLLERIANGSCRLLRQYLQSGGYDALKKSVRSTPGDILREVEVSGLRGRGGAAFPTGKKWRAVAEQSAPEKYVVANADEGDPGAYIDRFLLEDDPHALIEGMALAALAVGARHGVIYLRKEYPRAHSILQEAVFAARAAGLIGENVCQSGFSFELEIVVGQGSYLCGEETALLNSIEGTRPEVRLRPPYPTKQGLWGKPTLVNNVETLATIPWIVRRGGAAYHGFGFSGSRGTKLVSLNSLFHQPGLYEIEFGVPVRFIVEELGGGLKTGNLKGVIIGGPLAGILPPELLDTPFGFEELSAVGASVGHGGVVAFDEHTSVAELMQHVFAFGSYESCGKCTPCRLGSRRIETIFTQIGTTGKAPLERKTEVLELISALRLTSLCGLGTGLAEFADSVVRCYGKEFNGCFR